jgi:hypothetical protein
LILLPGTNNESEVNLNYSVIKLLNVTTSPKSYIPIATTAYNIPCRQCKREK